MMRKRKKKMEELFSSQALMYSLNKHFGMYVQIRFELDEPIVREEMQQALETTIQRYPYFKVRFTRIGDRYRFENNDAPFLLFDDPRHPTLDPVANNGYLINVSASGTLLNITFCHGLTDGRGILPFAKTLLYYYCLNHYKIDPQMSDVRLLGDAIPEAEVADPYAAFDASDLQMPAANAKKTEDVFHLTTSKDPEGRFFIHTFATDCDAFMSYAHRTDGSPNALFALFTCRAIAKLHPEGGQNIVVSVAADMRKALGVKGSHHCSITVLPIRYDARLAALDTETAATCIRGRIILQSDEDVLKPQLAQQKMFYSYLKGLPTLQEKVNISRMGVGRGSNLFTASVSYPEKQDYGAMNGHLKSCYIIPETQTGSLGVEIASFGDKFFFVVFQGFDDDRYAEELMHQLEEEGITCMDRQKGIVREVPFRDIL